MMTNLNYRLLPPKDEYVQVSIYLNRVHLDGYTPVKRSYPVGNRAIAQLIEMGYAPSLQYQWNPKRNEFDLFAVIHDRPIADSLMDKQACDTLWAAFNESSLYLIGCEAAQNPNWLAAGSFNDPRRHAAPEEIEPLQANATAAA
ncbi:MAG: hypothetical protein JGK24_04120 [Microcoleus sp. PH2017_29_MFU_D_A]|uniref:hypothetical protein n=1 Tax=unclassified Microcoleus TaxID=2642155 RepID=UPI001D2B3F55|nr:MULTISPECIES: hypothetical protein [unclassified Microcoleus]MCC3602430.1 hypothetical protein [Microcoleus sp. PH2017_29_MFU_D_A]MCC3633583.1 hypothetical protein [Microcoleus sp. PH2017_37_MFU_D_B]